jgi:hypothetical protein
VLSYYVSFCSEFRLVMSAMISHKNNVRCFCSVCLRLVSCVPNLSSFSRLPIFDSGFSSNVYSLYYEILIIRRTWLYIWWKKRVSYKKQELLTPCEHMGSHPVFVGVHVAFFVFCVVLFVLFESVLCLMYLMLPVSLDYPFLIVPSVFSNVYLPSVGMHTIFSEWT